jgi:UDP-glucuronate 4-epimerase
MMKMSKRAWVVTGGVGFIGYHLTRALLERGDAVTVLDDFNDAPYPTVIKRRHEHELRAEFPKFDVVQACVTDAERTREAYRGKDGVVHLAGLAGVRPSFLEPARYARVNVEGTATVIELALEAGINQVLFASSSSVYGNSTPLPAQESAPAIVPESPYAATKRGAELVAGAICLRAPHLSCTALRFFTVYGPRQRPEMAITMWARAILAGAPITMFGDGSMRRDFTHVDDIVRGVLASIDARRPGYDAYNFGSGAPVTLSTLIEALGVAAGARAIVQRAPIPRGDVDATFADIRRARDELGWSPRITLEEGLRGVIEWVRANP